MHIDRALRRPHPVVLTGLACFPLHTAEVDAPVRAGLGRLYGKSRGECGPRNGDLDTPSLISVIALVRGAFNETAVFSPGMFQELSDRGGWTFVT